MMTYDTSCDDKHYTSMGDVRTQVMMTSPLCCLRWQYAPTPQRRGRVFESSFVGCLSVTQWKAMSSVIHSWNLETLTLGVIYKYFFFHILNRQTIFTGMFADHGECLWNQFVRILPACASNRYRYSVSSLPGGQRIKADYCGRQLRFQLPGDQNFGRRGQSSSGRSKFDW